MATVATDVEDAYPLTRLQAGMLYHSELDAGMPTYHDLSSLRVTGRFNEQALRRVLAALAAGHHVLRTSIDLTRFSEPMQIVHARGEIPLTVQDLTGLGEAEQAAEVARWRAAERVRRFDLTKPLLFAVHVQLLGENDFWLNLSFHHAILDGWSLSLLTSQLLREYDRVLGGGEPRVTPPSTRFRDYVLLERKALADDTARHYWRELIADTDVPELPRWHDVPPGTSRSARVHAVALPADLTASIRAIAATAAVPVKAVLYAVHAAVLSRLTGQDRVVTGRVTNGRAETPDGDQVVGLFLNVLPLVVTVPGATWTELARQVHQAEVEALPFRRYPLGQILRDGGREALFHTIVDFRSMRRYAGLRFDHLSVDDTDFFEQTNFAFTANYGADPVTGEIRLRINYDEAEFSAAQIESIGGYYRAAFAAMIDDPHGQASCAPLLGEAELHRQLVEWNDSATPLPVDRALPELLAPPDPDRTAVRCGARTLSYAELHARANRLAWRLRELGAGPDAVVGVHMGRSPELIVAVLAVLKSGAAYLPLDPAYPPDRLAFMLADSGAQIVLADGPDVPASGTTVLTVTPDLLDHGRTDEPDPVPDSAHLAYVIYTSGSTGRPKGVQISHRCLVNLLYAMSAEVGLDAEDRWLALTSLSFDIAGLEVFGPLLTGAELIILPDGAADGPRLLAELDATGATIIQATPSSWRLLVEAGLTQRRGLRAICGGEALPADLARELANRVGAVWNAYGPTETTIWSCLDRITADETVTIGRPLANTTVYVLDEQLRPLPTGAAGELYIGGDGVARGYRARPGLTAGRFVAAPWGPPGSRLFRTGDTVRWRTDGRLEFLGRADHQVKVRGHRIELGEIETVLAEHPAVRQAVAVPRDEGPAGKRLVAYLTVRDAAAPTPAELRRHLSARLPEHMVPSAFVTLDAFPSTPNGKVDRKRLPDVTREHVSTGTFVEPTTESERRIAALWAEELGLDRVGATDTFRDVGGHSIAALRIVLRIREATGVDVPIASLLTGGTVAMLAEAVDGVRQLNRSVLVPLREVAVGQPYFFVHPLGGTVFCYAALTDALPDQPVYALQAFDMVGRDGPRPDSIEELARRYLREVRTVRPRGPYRLGGWCMGGVVAYEMARMLQAEGEEIELLATFSSSIEDPVPPEYAEDESVAMLGAFGDNLPITLDELRAIEPSRRLAHVVSLAQGDLARPDVTSADDLRRLVGVYRRHAKALLAYRDGDRPPYRGDVLVVRAEDGEYASPDLGWRSRVDGNLVMVESPGTHSSMMLAPNAAHLAELLRHAARDGVTAAASRREKARG